MITKRPLSILPRRLVFQTEPSADIADICYTLMQEDAQVALAVNNQPGILADASVKKRWNILWITVSNLPCFIQCAWLSPRRGCSLPRVKNLPEVPVPKRPFYSKYLRRLCLYKGWKSSSIQGEAVHQQVSKRNGEVQADRGKRDNWMMSNRVRLIYYPVRPR